VTLHPNTQALLDFFKFDHLPPHLADVSKRFHELAHEVAQVPGPETTVCLRKLLEAKDCFEGRRSDVWVMRPVE
jgi:hypothetical protein